VAEPAPPVAAQPAADPPPSAPPPEAAAPLPPLPVDPANPYPGDGAPKEAIAAWMAHAAEQAGLPRELPIMAALVESGLTNVQGGDRDSIGFFQMRTSFWNQGPYAGYPQNPELQLKWFIDQALAVKAKRVGEGNSAFLTDPAQWGEWIADVERPAEEFRGRYQTRLEEARALLPQPAAGGG
jgi:hypothetical protein